MKSATLPSSTISGKGRNWDQPGMLSAPIWSLTLNTQSRAVMAKTVPTAFSS